MDFNLFCPHWVFAASGLPLVAASRGHSLAAVLSFSLQWLLSLQSVRSRVHGLQWLQHGGSVVTDPGSRAQAQ